VSAPGIPGTGSCSTFVEAGPFGPGPPVPERQIPIPGSRSGAPRPILQKRGAPYARCERTRLTRFARCSTARSGRRGVTAPGPARKWLVFFGYPRTILFKGAGRPAATVVLAVTT